MDVAKFIGFDENTVLQAISLSVMFSEIVKNREKSIMVSEDVNSNTSLKLNSDNDSGYISQNVESNSVSSVDENNAPMVICTDIRRHNSVYVDEDALLEKPQISNPHIEEQNEDFEEFGHLYYMNHNSCVESSVVSQKTNFSGFDSNESAVSNVISVATPLVLELSNPIANDLENDPNYININNHNNTNVITSFNKIGDKNYEQLECKLSRTKFNNSILDDNSYSNSLSFSSTLCNLYDEGFGDSNTVSSKPDLLETNTNDTDELLKSPCIKSYTELKTKLNLKESHLLQDSHKISTQEKRTKAVNSDLSPELFSDDEAVTTSSFELQCANTSRLLLPKGCEQTNINKNDQLLITRIQKSLGGVPPPPSVTIIQMTVEEMLQKIYDNENLFIRDYSDVENVIKDENCDKKCTSLLISCKKQNIEGEEFPNVMKYRYHGLHFNTSKLHEDLEYMWVKYAERYIGAETQSSCTMFGMATDNSSPSKRKYKFKRAPAKSPGKRLSHLARRRITFSKDSLQSVASSSNNSFIGSRTRQIMIDAKKVELMSRRHSPFKRKSPLKMPGRSPRKKLRTPSSSAKKRFALRSKLFDTDESLDSIPSVSTTSSSRPRSSKRALFQKSPSKGHSTTGLLRLLGADMSEPKSSKRKTPRRALFISPIKTSPSKTGLFSSRPSPRRCLFSPDKGASSAQGIGDKKRKRINSEEEPATKFSKTTLNPNSVSSDVTIKRKASSNGSAGVQILNIVEHRKKKLMWAVAEALRPHNVDIKHPQFKIFASALARITRHFLPNLFVNGPRPEGSTTENMLRIVRQYAFAVTRGKTVEEIVSEAKSLQARRSGLAKVLTESSEARNKDNIAHGSNSGNSDADFCKSKRKENVERIRKVIDFDDGGGSSTKR